MEKHVEYYQQDVVELHDADILSKVLTVDNMVNDTVVSSFDVVYKSDFDKLLRLYNSLIKMGIYVMISIIMLIILNNGS